MSNSETSSNDVAPAPKHSHSAIQPMDKLVGKPLKRVVPAVELKVVKIDISGAWNHAAVSANTRPVPTPGAAVSIVHGANVAAGHTWNRVLSNFLPLSFNGTSPTTSWLDGNGKLIQNSKQFVCERDAAPGFLTVAIGRGAFSSGNVISMPADPQVRGPSRGSLGWLPAMLRAPLGPVNDKAVQPPPLNVLILVVVFFVPRWDNIKVMYWNIHHDFTLKLTSPEFQTILKTYDIMFFAETDMLPGEDDPADVPRGYTLLSLPRRPTLSAQRRGGGITLIIRDNLDFNKSNLSSPDILVLDMGSIWLIGAYIPPVSSRWQGWTDIEPIQMLWETAALCTQSDDKPVLVLTDINAQTGSSQVESEQGNLVRISSDPDTKTNARGRTILNECDTYGLVILNGTSFETASPGRFTSWQPG
ncbi:hypothetical protein K438DRAFT_1972961 [Mycena galopus ATCC 62051]|nr:hypothetical protein K438DRAFT_1972961 [Mycena galopus ATCC 62051]